MRFSDPLTAKEREVPEPETLSVPWPAVRSLLARGASATRFADLGFDDPLARRLAMKLGLRALGGSEVEQRAAVLRARCIDALANRFFELHPKGLGVGAGSHLETRAFRLASSPRWVDIDEPSMAEVRREVLPERAGYCQVGQSMAGSSWLDGACSARESAILLVLDDAWVASPARLEGALDQASERLPSGSEIVVVFDARSPLRPSRPLTPGSPVELLLGSNSATRARYPRLRFIEEGRYVGALRAALGGINAFSQLHRGRRFPSIAHLVLV